MKFVPLLAFALLAPVSAMAAPPPSSEPGVVWNPFVPSPDNQPLTLRILVLNYNPIAPAEGHRRLSEVFKWNEPERLASRYLAAMEYATGGAVRYEVTEWRNLNEIYAQVDGYRPTVEEYVRNRRGQGTWHKGGGQDYPRLLREQGVAEMVSRGEVDEVWIFSDHYFGVWEASMAGPGAFNINGGVYPEVPSARPFAFYGFNYERGVAEMMHDAAHRVEATLNRVYGGWKLAAPVSNWDKFSANFSQSNGVAGVGTCHWPANANSDYDYGNTREVESWADAFLSYPRLDWTTKKVSRATWSTGGPDAHLDYMKWYFAHIPRAAGVNEDGRANNWFKYIWNFENFDRRGKPLAPRAMLVGRPIAAVGERGIQFAVAFSAASHLDPGTVNAKAIAASAPDGAALDVTLLGNVRQTAGPYCVAWFSATPKGGVWRAEHAGAYRLQLQGGVLSDCLGQPFAEAELGSFQVLGGSQLTQVKPAPPRDALFSFAFGGEERIGGTKPRSFNAKGRIEASRGTVEMWVKPEFPSNSPVSLTLLRVGAPFDCGMVLARDSARNLRFQQWGDDPATPTVERNVERDMGTSAAEWPADEWRHLALVWDGEKRVFELYVNGRLLESKTNGVRLTEFSTSEMLLGPDSQITASIRDLHIYGRVKTAGEIATAYEAGRPRRPLAPSARELAIAPGERKRITLAEQGGDTPANQLDLTCDATWSAADPAVIAIPAHGWVIGKKPGRTDLRIAYGGQSVSVPVEVRATLPSASMENVRSPAGPGDPLQVTVAFRSSELAPESLGFGDLLIHGGGSICIFGEPKISPEAPEIGATKVVYTFAAPPAGWPTVAAKCRVELKAWQVRDTAGTYFPETDLGSVELRR